MSPPHLPPLAAGGDWLTGLVTGLYQNDALVAGGGWWWLVVAGGGWWWLVVPWCDH